MRAGLLLLGLLLSLPARPAEVLSRSEESFINFGFATQLGSGVYSLSGRTLQVYNLPFSWDLPAREDSRLQWRVVLPVTIGFLDFKAVDVLETGLPQHLDSFGFVPGVELDWRIRSDWMLQPFVQAGIARDRANRVDQRVYAGGLRSYYDFAAGPVQWQQYTEVARVVVDQVSLDGTDDFTRVRVGITGRRPFETSGAAQRADILGYAFVEIYTDSPAGPANRDSDQGSKPQYEVGFTLGATQGLHLWKIPLPRVGFGYRFGDGLDVYRLVLGSPY